METELEKALEFHEKFQQYKWDDKDGFLPDHKETKKICINIINEIIDACEYNNVESWNTDWWNRVKSEINKV